MNTGKSLFAQLMDFLPWTTFARGVDRYDGNRRARTFPCAEHFRVMAFAQLAYRESLRDIEACLSAQSHNLSGSRCGARPWPTPTRPATGASTRSSPSD